MIKSIHRGRLSGYLPSSHSFAGGVTLVLLMLCLWLKPAVLTVNAASPGAVLVWGDHTYGETTIPAGVTNVIAIAGGEEFAVALKSDGTVVAWGDNTYGQTNVPAGLSNVTAIAAGDDFTVALKSNGTVLAWGDNSSGQTNVPAGLSNVTGIAAGYNHTVALKSNGTVLAWGDNTYGETNIPAGLSNVTAIAAGYYFTVALKSDGTVAAWGENNYGQTNVPDCLIPMIAIAARGLFVVALAIDNSVAAWGDNFYGEVTGTPTRTSPFQATACTVDDLPGGNLQNVTAIAAGDDYTVAVMSGGTVVAWGENFSGEVTGTPTSTSPYVATAFPVKLNGQVLNNVVAIAGGGDFTLAITLAYITTQPTNVTVNATSNATFSVTAIGTQPSSYQWYYNTSTLLTNATNATLTLANVRTNQAGNYTVVITNAYASVTSSVAVLTVNQLAQTISFGTLAAKQLDDAPFTLSATASSGLPVSYTSSNPGVATVSGNTVTITGVGSTTITAIQAGNATYLPATNVSQTFTVASAMRTLPGGYWPNIGFTVTIQCVPPSGIIDYAVEDDVFYGDYTNGFYSYGYGNITAISDGGTVNQNSVKWGPFFDDSPRALTYVVTPSSDLSDLVHFSGTISVDGVSQPTAGMTDVSFMTAFHPADNNPAIDSVISLNEVTAYASAWKNSLSWPVVPSTIPINYMTQAGLLWKGGEYYVYVATNTPPFCWVNATPPSPLPQTIPAMVATNAFRAMTNCYATNSPCTVTLTVTPASGVSVYAVEEQVLPVLSVGNFSTGGALDKINNKIKWGPFFDNSARTFSYQAIAPSNAPATIPFAGAVSFDGVSAAIAGAQRTRSGPIVAPQLCPSACMTNGQFTFMLTGSANDPYQIQTSTNLVNWAPLCSMINSNGAVQFTDSAPSNQQSRFYRAVVVP